MDALFLTPSYPVGMRPVDPTRRDPVGGGAFSALDVWASPKHEFILSFPNNEIHEAEALYAFYLRHRGSTPFLFDGAGRCEITEPQLLFIGDGSTVEFQLPFDNVFPPSWVFYQNDGLRTDWTMEESGLVIFPSAPALNAHLKGKGRRLAQVLFWGDGETPYTSEEFNARLFREGIVLREVD